jgi:hypothetical protein
MIGLLFSGQQKTTKAIYVAYITKKRLFEPSITIDIVDNVSEAEILFSKIIFFDKKQKVVHIEDSRSKVFYSYDSIY